MLKAFKQDEIKKDKLLLFVMKRSGMPEIFQQVQLWEQDGKDVALLTDGRFSGIYNHIKPEAQLGGSIALKKLETPSYKATKGALYNYTKNVKKSTEGRVTKE
ncbi:hypothetical protein Glove_213g185 [Diversispora epigaea]|uniref:Dihydroxy-acid/6-phosphogluconate dehydratase C-terminal domain-containing protein n=1 Tax=Diversispora epigaea TaxID=1348612 RepID=A0A397IMU1_9GLOM|nr:hypothetical protein Glove_213g185 [Diversispora epigaea]